MSAERVPWPPPGHQPDPGPAPWVAPAGPLDQRRAALQAAVADRPGWTSGGALGETVVAEFRPAPGVPGGVITGGMTGWRWMADDGAGGSLGGNCGGLSLDAPEQARDAVEAAVGGAPGPK